MYSSSIWSRPPLERVIEYLIILKLCGEEKRLLMAYDYACGMSPAAIGCKYGVSKHIVRSVVQRLGERYGAMNSTLLAILRRIVPIVNKVVIPIITCDGKRCVCIKCQESIPNYIKVKRIHITKYHYALIEYNIDKVIEELKKTLKNHKNGERN